MAAPLQTTVLTEYERTRLPSAALSPDAGQQLWQQYDAGRRVVDVAFPSPRTDGEWEITSLGWVGHIPLTRTCHFQLQPRAPLGNLFRMLDAVYGLYAPDFLPGLVQTDSLRGFYEQLAHYLALRVLARRRRGLFQAHVPREETLPYVRGRLRWQEHRPWRPLLDCSYDEQSADVADNQLLAWTLRRIAQSGLCRKAIQTTVRRAYHSLSGITPDASARASERYHRLNEDYAPLHALCHFFLTHTGPGHNVGDRPMLPFLVHMPRLYEQFVGRWLQKHLPPSWQLRARERITAGRPGAELDFILDMVLADERGKAAVVLDTKYKTDVSAADIHQMVAYAELRGCPEAILVYPQAIQQPLDLQIGHVRLRTLTFGLAGDLDAEGQSFLHSLDLGKRQHEIHKTTII